MLTTKHSPNTTNSTPNVEILLSNSSSNLTLEGLSLPNFASGETSIDYDDENSTFLNLAELPIHANLTRESLPLNKSCPCLRYYYFLTSFQLLLTIIYFIDL